MSLEEHIRDIQGKLKNSEYPNEQAISQGIVLRLISEMGWPIHDTQLVIPEYSVAGRRVDYALCVQKNKPVIFIEVKQPGNTLGADEQLFQYAYHKGVPFAILTDGKEWHFYLPAEVGSYNERRVYMLDLIERDVGESSSYLQRYLSYSEVSSGEVLKSARQDYENVSKRRIAKESIPEAWEKLIEEKDEILLEVVSEKVGSICGFKPEQRQVISYLKSLKVNLGLSPVPVTGNRSSLTEKKSPYNEARRPNLKSPIKPPATEKVKDDSLKLLSTVLSSIVRAPYGDSVTLSECLVRSTFGTYKERGEWTKSDEDKILANTAERHGLRLMLPSANQPSVIMYIAPSIKPLKDLFERASEKNIDVKEYLLGIPGYYSANRRRRKLEMRVKEYLLSIPGCHTLYTNGGAPKRIRFAGIQKSVVVLPQERVQELGLIPPYASCTAFFPSKVK